MPLVGMITRDCAEDAVFVVVAKTLFNNRALKKGWNSGGILFLFGRCMGYFRPGHELAKRIDICAKTVLVQCLVTSYRHNEQSWPGTQDAHSRRHETDMKHARTASVRTQQKKSAVCARKAQDWKNTRAS